MYICLETKNILIIWKLALGLNAIKLKFAVFNYSDEIERVTLSQRALREFWSIPTSLERATLTLFFSIWVEYMMTYISMMTTAMTALLFQLFHFEFLMTMTWLPFQLLWKLSWITTISGPLLLPAELRPPSQITAGTHQVRQYTIQYIVIHQSIIHNT